MGGSLEFEGDETAYTLLTKWDFKIEKESPGATLFEVFMETLLKKVFRDVLGENLYRDFSDYWLLSTTALDQVLNQNGPGWLNGRTREEVFDETLKETLDFLRKTLGEDPSDWKWGRLHTVSFEHPLGRKSPFDRLFNVGPFPYSGDGRTLLRSQYPHSDYKTRSGDSYRFLCDLSQPELSYSVLPPGQSGLWGTKHYHDQMDLWLKGEVHPNRMKDFEVEARLQLIPEKSQQ